MSKKDYIATAAILREHCHVATLRATAEAFADYFAAGNPRFDRARFLTACGLSDDDDATDDDATYRIVRRYEGDYEPETIATGLSLAEVQEHCQNPETSSTTATHELARERTAKYGRWFDGYEEE